MVCMGEGEGEYGGMGEGEGGVWCVWVRERGEYGVYG